VKRTKRNKRPVESKTQGVELDRIWKRKLKRSRKQVQQGKTRLLPPPEPADYKPEVYFDLDGTLAVNGWPDHIPIGDPIPESIELLKHYHSQGFVISIFTVRPEDHRAAIWDWLYYYQLNDLIYRVICDKPYYGLLIDDRSWNPPWLNTESLHNKSSQREGKKK